MNQEIYPTSMQPLDRERELMSMEIASLSLLKCIFNQNLFIMERLNMGEGKELQGRWIAEFESFQAQKIAELVSKYPSQRP